MKPLPEAGALPAVADPDRRAFLRGRFGKMDKPGSIRPPWSGESSLAAACTGCGACVEVCPEKIIEMDKSRRPRIDFSNGACSFCADCATACEAPVFSAPVGPAWRLTLSISDTCLVRGGIYCRSCGDACAEGAITFRPQIGGSAEISFALADCSGCGACISACPVGATSLATLPPAAEHHDA